jgi:copper(I)-binding protein
VHGGPSPATLISVTTDVAIKSEMHETMDKAAMSTMAPLARVEIPANTDVAFAPGGRHVMLFDMNSGIKPSDRVTLTFAFADGTRIINNATVVAAGTPVGK